MKDRLDKATVGKLGEDVACKYLTKHGYKVIERNYWKKWGEIDVIAIKDNAYHFVEVKSVTRSLSPKPASSGSGDNQAVPDYLAEENVHPWKLKRLSRAIQTYCLERNLPDDQAWQLDVITVELDFDTRNAQVKYLPDIG
ncbi:MAG: YraN family protein [Patescibacteria group bacterium]